MLFPKLKQLIRTQNYKISPLQKEIVKLQIVNEMLADNSVGMLNNNEVIAKAFRLKGVKWVYLLISL